MHACMHASIHPYIHSFIHTYIHTYICIYIYLDVDRLKPPTFQENLALYRLALASSQLSPEHAAARAVDGLFVTRWSPALEDEEPWISVDLGGLKPLSHLVLLWGEFSPSSYLIQGTHGRWGDIVFCGWWIIFCPQAAR